MYSLKTVYKKLKKFNFIFIFVRDPFDRLVSAYMDKFHNSPAGSSCYWCKETKRVLSRSRKEEIHNNSTLTFEEFLQYSLQHDNDHWRTYLAHSDPCQLNFSFIGKYESRDQDISVLLQQLYGDTPFNFPKTNSKTRSMNVDDFYKPVSSTTLQSIANKYKDDCIMFGYNCLKYLPR